MDTEAQSDRPQECWKMLVVVVAAPVFLSPVFVAYMMWRALRLARIQVGGNSVARAENPRAYWLLVSVYTLCLLVSVAVALGLGLLLILDPAP